jgi:hypothetical protein
MPLDLDRDMGAGVVPAQQVDGPMSVGYSRRISVQPGPSS